MIPAIPCEQVERLQPVVEALLEDLRRYTQALAPQIDLALAYQPAPEPAESVS
ncbi:MAG TPA: hypothetical protein VEV17_19420 [Bryobacteraceae bacterium]|nr:hypothetical protein [Bryobacteraceae bacterium]